MSSSFFGSGLRLVARAALCQAVGDACGVNRSLSVFLVLFLSLFHFNRLIFLLDFYQIYKIYRFSFHY